jgi:transcription antitermination factor NusG
MDMLIEGLRPLHTAADLRDQRESRQQDFRVGDNLEVSESDFADFEAVETNWTGTVPAGLVPPRDRDD